jgi:hypothetical protein
MRKQPAFERRCEGIAEIGEYNSATDKGRAEFRETKMIDP